MTARQMEILRAVDDYAIMNGYAPSIRDLAAHFRITVKGASDHLNALRRQGLIVSVPRVARSVRVSLLGREALDNG